VPIFKRNSFGGAMNLSLKRKDKEQSEKSPVQELKKYDILKGLKSKELRQIYNLVVTRRFKPGEIIYKKGFPHTVLYFVAEGDVKIYLEKDDEEIELIHKKPYEHFGEVGLFIDMNRTASARAEEPTVLLSLTKKDFKEFVKNSPRVGVKILNNISNYLCQIMIENNKKIMELHNQSNENQNK
jgi:CRP-like cAMP-binding protein